ncbi:hypothetical protein AQJ67_21460 [Streptomyces caeruleatus]|uniref:Novel STAND NTPase 1 domain-containing protein n=1 Tax=Streptomyces caeruleatus TaxID=661399 RepID=A0A101U231_9ACTN|nr:hypothetical protein AQJ67_21460 [Streptomyces caeruleatus]
MSGFDLPAAVAQILDSEGRAVGAGFLVAGGLLVTCAHVVVAAESGPGDGIRLAFPHAHGARQFRGLVVAEAWRAPEHDDVALVRLEEAPDGVEALPLGSAAGCRGHAVRSFGFPAQAPPGGHFGYGVAGDLLPAVDDTGGAAVLQLTDANDLTTGFSGGPVVDEVTGLVIGMLTAVSAPDTYLKGQDIAYATPAQTLREVWPDLVEQQVCPYRGLEPFTAEHAEWFHGREAAVERVLSVLGGQRVLLLLGPSGAGKSSLIQAGVLPALAEGGLPGSDRWPALVVRPGEDLPLALEQAGLPGAATDGILPAVEHELAAEPGRGRLLLVVDQFEELLTGGGADGPNPQDGLAAVEQLVTAIGSQAAVSVVLVMRDDFYPRLAALAPALLEAAAPGLLNVPAALNAPELHAIITRPARAVGAVFEDGLPERIITDVLAADPAASTTRQAAATLLPPLELALSQLWERRHDGRLTHQAYQQIGEVTGSLTTWCNSAVGQLPAGQRAIARRLLAALVRPADDAHAIPATRQRVPLTDLKSLTADIVPTDQPNDEAFEQVLAGLTRNRIITTRIVSRPDGGPGVAAAELIHDALIRDWQELRDWVAENHQFHAWLHRAGAQRARFTDSGHPGDLLDGTDLAEGTAWARQRGIPADIAAFLTASHRHQQSAARRTRRINTVLAALLALALIATGLAWWQRQTAVDARQTAQSRQLAAQSAALMDTDPDLASLLAVQAYRTSPTAEATGSLYTAAARPLRFTFDVPTEAAYSMAFSPDGKTLATGGENGTVGLRDIATGKPRKTIRTGHAGSIANLALGADGGTIVTSAHDGTVRLQDAVSGRTRATLTGHRGVESSLAVSSDGHTLADTGDDTVRVWDMATAETRKILRTGEVDSVALSPDGRTVATGGSPDGRVRLWDVATGTVRRTIKTGTVFKVLFSPDGRTLVTGSPDKEMQLWDVVSGKPRATLENQGEASYSVAFSPNGRTLAVGDYAGGTVRLWDVDTGRSRGTVDSFAGDPDSLAFSPDGHTLAVGSAEHGTVRLWDVAVGKTLIESPAPTNAVYSVAFSPDGTTLAIANSSVPDNGTGTGEVRLTDAATGKTRVTLTGHTSPVDTLAFSPDGRTLATYGWGEEKMRLWDVATGRPRRTIAAKGPVSLAFSPDSHTLAMTTGSIAQGLKLWDVATGKTRRTIHDGFGSFSFSPDGRTLITSVGYAVRLWDVATGKPRKTIDFPDRSLSSSVFSPDGRTVATRSDDRTVRLWDVATGKPRVVLTADTGKVLSVVFSPDSRTLATGSDDGSLRSWDVATGKARAVFTGHTGKVLSVAFSPDGRTLVTGSDDRTVRRWEAAPPDPTAAVNRVCRAVHRNFTPNEAALYLRDRTPEPVCPS